MVVQGRRRGGRGHSMYQSVLFKLLRYVTFIGQTRGGEGKGAVGRVGSPGSRVGLPPWPGVGGFPGHPDSRSPVGGSSWGVTVGRGRLEGLPFAPPLSPWPRFRGRRGKGPTEGQRVRAVPAPPPPEPWRPHPLKNRRVRRLHASAAPRTLDAPRFRPRGWGRRAWVTKTKHLSRFCM